MSDLSFDKLFGDAKLDVECPNCNKKIKFTLKQVGTKIKCTHCSSQISLEDDNNSVKNSKKGIDKSLKELSDAFKNF